MKPNILEKKGNLNNLSTFNKTSLFDPISCKINSFSLKEQKSIWQNLCCIQTLQHTINIFGIILNVQHYRVNVKYKETSKRAKADQDRLYDTLQHKVLLNFCIQSVFSEHICMEAM